LVEGYELSLLNHVPTEEITRLPRMDVSWFLAGVLMANNYHLRYVIVSGDSEKGHNSSIGYYWTCRWDCEE